MNGSENDGPADTALYLNDSQLYPRVQIHPVVLSSILDHYIRRQETQNRVIGTILGEVLPTGVVEVTNCFPVPHNETAEQVSVDLEFHRTMFDLSTKSNPKEVIVGWYATGMDITEHSILINEFYEAECNRPVHLTVDVTLTNDEMAIKAYCSSSIGTPDNSTGTIFIPLSTSLICYDAERVAIDTLQRGKMPKSSKFDIMTDMDHLESSLISLRDNVIQAQKYCQDVVDGNQKGDPRIGKQLLDVMNVVPKLDTKEFERLFNGNLQDLLLVVYLSNLCRQQLNLGDRLKMVI
eukprot:Clim_evm29s44 gene=Clim_evmTU29s44